MPDLCSECERLWREYSATLHEYLGLSRAMHQADEVRNSVTRCSLVVSPRTEFRPTLNALRNRISQHEGAAHSDGNVEFGWSSHSEPGGEPMSPLRAGGDQ